MAIKPKIAPSSLNVSDKVQDLSIIHAINLERLKADQVSTVLDILDDLGLSIQKQLEKIDPTGVGPTYRSRRLAKLLKLVNATTTNHYKKAASANKSGLSGVAAASAKATQNIVNSSLGVSLGATLPPTSTLQALAGKVLVEGDTIGNYWSAQSAQVRGNFVRQMRMGIAGGEPLQQLIARVRGTKENNFSDGIMNATKKKAEALVRSSVAAVNNQAILNTYEANADLFNGYQWLATLDTRTSDICKARSGLTWDMNFQPVGHGIAWSPPPAHFNCRSTVIGVLKPWSDLADKPLPAVGAKTLKEELQKSLEARGLSPALISSAINKTQKSMDGYVAGDINFEDWLKGKSESFQKQILGEPKWELWKNGKIGFVDLVDQKSNPRSVAELQALVDQGRTAPLKASKAAREKAKAEAEAAALAVKAAQRAEDKAQKQIDAILSKEKGTATKAQAYKKIQNDIEGLTATQIMAKVDEGVAQINLEKQIYHAKQNLKKGKKLSTTQQAAWDTVDDDLKAAFIASISEAPVYKAIDEAIEKLDFDFIDKYDDFGEDINDILEKYQDFDWFEKQMVEFADEGMNELGFFQQHYYITPKWKEKLQEARKFDEGDAQAFLNDFNTTLKKMEGFKRKADAILAEVDEFFVDAKTSYANLLKTSVDPDDVALGENPINLNSVLEIDILKEDYLMAGPDDVKLVLGEKINSLIASLGKKKKEAEEVAKKLMKADQDAFVYLEDAAEGKLGTYDKPAFDKLLKEGKLTGSNVENAALVKETAANMKDAKAAAAMKASIKKKFKDGKKLSPKQQEAFDAYDPIDQELLKDAGLAGKSAQEVEDEFDKLFGAKEVEKAVERSEKGVLFDDLEQIGDQDGSNTGGLFRSKVDGQEYYVKAPDTELMAKVEVLSAKLYQAVGVKVADVNLMNIKGKIGGRSVDRVGVSSRIEKISDLDTSQMGAVSGAKEGFAADAWLANWDVIGNGAPKQLNLKKMADGSSFRIDTGGTLFFRAQGGRKAFSADEVLELDSMRFNSYNSGAVFGDISEDQIVTGVARIVALEDDDIRRLVNDIMGDDADDLADVLIGRKNVLARTYKKQLDKLNKKAQPRTLPRVTKEEIALIEESRVNGYVLPSDKLDIEDHEIRANFLKRKGEDFTVLNLRLREKALKKLEKSIVIDSSDTGPKVFSMRDVNDQVITAIKGIMSRGSQGVAFEAKDFERARNAIKAMSDMQTELFNQLKNKKITQKAFDEYQNQISYPLNVLENFNRTYSVGDIKRADDQLFYKNFVNVTDIEEIIEKTEKTAGVVWRQPFETRFFKSNFRKSFAEQDGSTYEGHGLVVETEIEGVKVRYFKQSRSSTAMQGRMEIETAGASQESINKALSVLDGLGIDTQRTTALDREELYLRKIYYHFSGVRQSDEAGALYSLAFKEKIKEIDKIASQNQRIKMLKEATSDAAKVKDITASPLYNPQGEYQQFGHGKALQLNPAFTGSDWEEFFEETAIYHDLSFGSSSPANAFKNIVQGGGQLASTAERMRRGVPIGSGGSEEADMKTGGSSYVFTRLIEKSKIGRRSGLVWKSRRHVRRLDSISYQEDFYGSQRFSTGRNLPSKMPELEDWDVALQLRAVDLKYYEQHRSYGGNELIFKDGLSVFEDLQFFIVSRFDKEDVIEFLQNNGYKKWPDGRALDEVIVTSDEARTIGYQG